MFVLLKAAKIAINRSSVGSKNEPVFNNTGNGKVYLLLSVLIRHALEYFDLIHPQSTLLYTGIRCCVMGVPARTLHHQVNNISVHYD